jgi:hypothetical protein
MACRNISKTYFNLNCVPQVKAIFERTYPFLEGFSMKAHRSRAACASSARRPWPRSAPAPARQSSPAARWCRAPRRDASLPWRRPRTKRPVKRSLAFPLGVAGLEGSPVLRPIISTGISVALGGLIGPAPARIAEAVSRPQVSHYDWIERYCVGQQTCAIKRANCSIRSKY